jgi:hypothetical protein
VERPCELDRVAGTPLEHGHHGPRRTFRQPPFVRIDLTRQRYPSELGEWSQRGCRYCLAIGQYRFQRLIQHRSLLIQL